jgi:putative protease
MNNTLELLSPAKNADYGIAAVKHGADAVYVGASRYGARAAVGNDIADIARLVAFAHRYRAKVYCTLNTILYDDELADAERIAHELCDAGVDALIVQDMAFAEMGLPLPLFASTQCDNMTPEKVTFLEDVGFKRVILARELSLDQIRAVRARSTVDLEAFVHGALCVSYSGRCYFSQAVCGRSANRGECAQPCRQTYDLYENGRLIAKNKHLLSLKDLDLSAWLSQLVDAGISSFKIEGRLKDEAYLKNITALYRRELDRIIEGTPRYRKASSGSVTFGFVPDAAKTFNRGSIAYFVNGRSKGHASFDTPKFFGEYVGTVSNLYRDSFKLDTDVTCNNADGITFFDASGELQGTNINSVKDGIVYPNRMTGIAKGTKIYRNHDAAFAAALARDTTKRTVGVSMRVDVVDGIPVLTLTDEDGICVTISAETACEAARDQEKAKVTISQQLEKLGQTMFHAVSIDVVSLPVPHIPISAINDLRRRGIDALEKARAAAYVRTEASIEPNAVPYPQRELDYTANVANEKARAFYTRHAVTKIDPALETRRSSAGDTLMTTKYCILHEMGKCRKGMKTQAEYQLENNGRRYLIETDCTACEMRVVRT